MSKICAADCIYPGWLNLQDRKVQDWKMTDKSAGLENAGLSFSSPVNSSPALLSVLFQSRIFHTLKFLCPSFSCPAKVQIKRPHLSLLVSTQLFFESLTVVGSEPAKPTRKQNLTRNSQSRSFKVMHFGITEKPTTDCVSPCNNTGLISKVSWEIASKNA